MCGRFIKIWINHKVWKPRKRYEVKKVASKPLVLFTLIGTRSGYGVYSRDMECCQFV